ncbi:hypothetical protein LAZ67_X004251 [Cordylochernes scorpioides]|uniref:Reverse transcriptase domain-containing protein n=1 Tax=Cordylochernes scorpioides TaxID=51811 RepID=A0ABY6LXD7_9ARAC|nr:hypothetical protein LAZ67_X004251 [Cordylochernes scorpioides]
MTDLIKMYDNSDLTSVYLPEFGDVHLLMYADDIAIIGESRINLQKKNNILKEYLGENYMTLNESKSKVMVFRNGGKPSIEDRWYWNGKPLMVTRIYNYLGYPLVSTTKTTQAANFFKGKALAAINATTPILAKSKIDSLNSAMKLFDSIVMAVLMYAAPIWATEYKGLLDHIQDTFIRRFLNLPRYTPGYIIRLETGRVSLIITALKLTLKYWLRVLSMDTNRLPRICLNRMRQISCATGAPIGFIKQLSNLLNNNGSSWLTYCNDPDSLRNAIPGILRTAIEQTIQNDLTRITQSKLYSHYRDIYTTFTTEEYFLSELPFPVIRLIAQFSTLSIFFREHHLILLRREDLKCTFCGSGITTEMLHYLFDCAALSEERRKLNDKTGQLCPSFPALINEISKRGIRGALIIPANPDAGALLEEVQRRRKTRARHVPLVAVTSHTALLKRYEEEGDHFLEQIVTGDESWCYHYDPSTKRASMEWKRGDSPRPKKKKIRSQRSTGKVLLTIFWDVDGPICLDFLSSRQRMNSDLYCDILVNKLKPGIRNKRRGKLSKGVLFLHGNARPHTSCKTVSTIIKLGFEVLEHPAYSPDLAPSDYFLFGLLKKELKGKRFDSDEDVQKVVQDFFHTLPKSAYKEGIYMLPERWRRCIESQGDYFE